MSTYKLTYFEARGVAETTRLLMALTGTEYTDERLTKEQWADRKKDTPFRQLPVLEVKGVQICSSRAIEKLVAKITGRYGSNIMDEAKIDMVVGCLDDMVKPLFEIFRAEDSKKPELKKKYASETAPGHLNCLNKMINSNGHVLEKEEISYADVAIFYAMSFPKKMIGDDFDKLLADNECANINTLIKKVETDKNIAAWIAKRPETEF